jgi:hypothetical protein
MFSSLVWEAESHDRVQCGNTTGFCSPAGDSLECRIDLGEILDLARPSRYPVRISGDALASRGILSGDILIADAASPPAHGKVAVVHAEWLGSGGSARPIAAVANARFGRGSLRPASTGLIRAWAGRQARHPPRYTTSAEEMLVGEAF